MDDTPHPRGAGQTPIVIRARYRRFIWAGAAVFVAWVIYSAPGALTILLGGSLLALILRYPFEVLSRFMPRRAAVAVILAILALIVVGAAVLLIPPLLSELQAFVRDLPVRTQKADVALRDLITRMVESGALPAGSDLAVSNVQQELLARATRTLSHAFDYALITVRGVFRLVIQAFGVTFVAVYLLLDAPKLKDASIRHSPSRYQDDVRELWEAGGQALSRYLVSLVIVAAVQGTVATAFLWALGVPYPLLLGSWIAATSTIPYIGTWFGGIPAIVMAAFVSPLTALLTFLLFFASTTVVGNIVTPRVQGHAVRVHPVLVLLTVVAAGELFGILGVFLAVPGLAIGRVLFDFLWVRVRTEEDRTVG